MATGRDRSANARSTENSEDPPWPPSFPHADIDELTERLAHAGSLSPEDASRLLAMVAKEAQRLRSAVVRLSVQKLSVADKEAREILEHALAQADELKALGLSTLEDRLDEAERLHTGMRLAFRDELSAHRTQPDSVRDRARIRLATDPDDVER